MTGTRKGYTGIGLLLAAAILLGFLAGPTGTRRNAPRIPQGEDYIANAAVIKTQKAADSIFRQGGIRGIDVSKYQGNINWSKVAKSDVDFVFVRASYGTTKDPYFLKNAKEAHENGLKVGAYHYATFKNSDQVKKEAAYFVSRLKKVDITYPAVLDLESVAHKSIKRSTLTKLAIEFMELVKAEGYDVMLYSYNNFIRDHLDVKKLSGYDLWIANYLEQPTVANHKVWQHTSAGSVSGIKGNVDINVAYTSLSGGSKKKSSSQRDDGWDNDIRSDRDDRDNRDDAGDSAVRKVRVNKTISDQFKVTLNEMYGAGLPVDGLNMARMNEAIAAGIQLEIGDQWGVSLPVTGALGYDEAGYLSEVNWNSSVKGNITYLLQAKLFYKGYYVLEPTGRYDDHTMEAVRDFQLDSHLSGNGILDYDTLCALFLSQ